MAKSTPAAKPTLLRDVPLGHYARLADGWVRVAAVLVGTPYVRRAEGEPLRVADDGARVGPRPMPGHTPVFDARAPAASADRTAVADPLAGAADRETNLFHLEKP